LITPSWGSDPNFVQGGLELTAEAATGDSSMRGPRYSHGL